MGRYESYHDQESGLRFKFKCEPSQPSLLHIVARHGTGPEDAISTFFEGETNWNETRKRSETFTETHGLYWAWRARDTAALVISCFRRNE